MWIPGYITNGLGDHTLEQAILLLEESGYSSIGITLGPTHLDPEQVKPSELESLQQRLKDSGLKPAIETGGRYLLDHKRKHWPSLVSPEEKHRKIRQQSYIRAIDIAAAIGAEVVSLWSGRLESGSDSVSTLEGMISALEPV
ncbi:MAG: TIM barrel protein, partial [Proteobacteria bacterium]|nr:TIM barrel protein [Pseudomonadota bacterium]